MEMLAEVLPIVIDVLVVVLLTVLIIIHQIRVYIKYKKQDI